MPISVDAATNGPQVSHYPLQEARLQELLKSLNLFYSQAGITGPVSTLKELYQEWLRQNDNVSTELRNKITNETLDIILGITQIGECYHHYEITATVSEND